MSLRTPALLLAAVLPAVVAIAGCASLTRELTQPVTVHAPGCSEEVSCTLSHKRGSYQVTVPPGVTQVRRSDDPLQVSCSSGEKHWIGQIEGQRGGRAWGNVIFGGGIGGIIDANTDAHWDYPASFAVPLCTGDQQ